MNKKIAIHHHSGGFSDQWIAYCKKKSISYKLINAFDTDIVEQISDCDIFMWHHSHMISKDMLAAKKILFSLEHAGIRVFPDFRTGWHFDDKVAQKYLLEAIRAPLVPSYVFYDKQKAVEWARAVSFPKVFKLKGGSGASNVRLVKTRAEAIRLINRAFGKGFENYSAMSSFMERVRKFKSQQASFISVIKGAARFFISPEFSRMQAREKGYIYFQDFISGNDFDTRVVVVSGKYAAAEKRFVRKGDFRASGSGVYCYEDISLKAIELAFYVANQLDMSAVAFDIIQADDGRPMIVEISYGFGTTGISKVPGYWDNNLTWYDQPFTPEQWMVDHLLLDDRNKN